MTLAENKQLLIAARRAGDDELAKVLSQERQRLKRKRFCAVCDVPIKFGSRHCYQHSIMRRFYGRALLLLCATSACAQIQMGSNSVYAAVDGTVQITQDGSNFVTVPCNGIIFNFVDQTTNSDKAKPSMLKLPSIRSRLTNALNVATNKYPGWVTNRDNSKPASHVARSWSDYDATDTWTVTCPACQHKFNLAVKLAAPSIERIP